MKKITSFFSSKIVKGVIVFIIVGALSAAVYFYMQYQKVQSDLKNQVLGVNNDNNTLIDKVAGHMQLPAEKPTIATVSDKSKLEGQAFFRNAENGDKVLIFTNAQKAILYRQSTDRIIEVGPINLTQPTPTHTAPQISSSLTITTTPSEKTLTILNGTKRSGLTKIAQTQIDDLEISVTVKNRGNSKGDGYTKSLVYDVTENNAEMVKTIAKKIEADIVKILPKDEEKPDTDILLILGDNYENNQ